MQPTSWWSSFYNKVQNYWNQGSENQENEPTQVLPGQNGSELTVQEESTINEPSSSPSVQNDSTSLVAVQEESTTNKLSFSPSIQNDSASSVEVQEEGIINKVGNLFSSALWPNSKKDAPPPPEDDTPSISMWEKTKTQIQNQVRRPHFLSGNIDLEVEELEDTLLETVKEMRENIPHLTEPVETSKNKEKEIDPELKKIQGETDKQLEKLTGVLTDYALFQVLHEWAAGQNTPPNNVAFYEKLVATRNKNKSISKKDKSIDKSVWEVYLNGLKEAGIHLGWFSYIKAFIFYHLFCSLSNYIPMLSEQLLKSFVNGCRTHLSKPEHVSMVISKVLSYAESYLQCTQDAISIFCDPEKRKIFYESKKETEEFHGSLDEFKAKILKDKTKLKNLQQVVKEDSAFIVDTFFTHIEFASFWKNHSFFLLNWFGTAISFLINLALNKLTTVLLKRYAVPLVIKSTFSDYLTEAPIEKNYIFSRTIYQLVLNKVLEIRRNIQEKTSIKHSPYVRMNPIDQKKLGTVATLITDVFDMPEGPESETAGAINEHKQNVSSFGIDKSVRPQIISSIVKGGEIVVDLLHDPLALEDFFKKMLESLHEAFTDVDKDYKKIKRDHDQLKAALDIRLANLVKLIVQDTIDEEANPEIRLKHTKTLFEDIQKKALESCKKFRKPLQTMKQNAAKTNAFLRIDEHRSKGPFESFSTESFEAMREFCIRAQELISQLNMLTIVRDYPRLTPEEQDCLNRSFQPIRKALLELIQAIKPLNIEQNEHYYLLQVKEELEKTRKLLSLLSVESEEFSKDRDKSEIFLSIAKKINEANKCSNHLLDCSQGLKTPIIPVKDQIAIQAQGSRLITLHKQVEESDNKIQELISLVEKEIPNLISCKTGNYKYRSPDFKSLDATKVKISRILSNNFPLKEKQTQDEIKKLLDRILKSRSADRKSWNTLEKWILEQSAKLYPEFTPDLQEILRKWAKMPPGKENFKEEIWQVDVLDKYSQNPKALPLLEQISDFLREGSMINVYYHQIERLFIEPKIDEQRKIQNEAATELNDSMKSLLDFIEETFEKIADQEKEIYYKNIKKSVRNSEAALKNLVSEIRQTVFLAPISLSDIARKLAEPLKRHVGNQKAVPLILRIIQNALNELNKPPMKEAIASAVLKELTPKKSPL